MLALALALPANASAHELPKGVELLWPPGSAKDALPVVLTNRGLIFPVEGSDAHAFELRCNEAYGATTAEVPGVSFDASGEHLVLVTSTSVGLTADQGCTFQHTLERTDIEDVLGSFVVRNSEPPEFFLATQDPTRQSKVMSSRDFGQTWDVSFTNAAGELFTELRAAPSDANRMYATGYHFERTETQISLDDIWARSDDGGKNFVSVILPKQLRIVGIHPTDADVIFAREWVDNRQTSLRLLRSEDGGANFTEILTAQGDLVLTGTPDGGTLWLGSSYEGGLFRSVDGGKSFEQIWPELIEVDCIVFREDTLYLCANREGVDGIWKLSDGADALEAVLVFEQVTRAVVCENAAAASVCRVPWLDWQIEILPPPESEIDAGLGSDAGEPDEPDADAGIDSGVEIPEPPAKKTSDGCGCSLLGKSGAADSSASLLFGALCALSLVRRLRRGRVNR